MHERTLKQQEKAVHMVSWLKACVMAVVVVCYDHMQDMIVLYNTIQFAFITCL